MVESSPSIGTCRIAVLLTCHNRKAKTLACLQALFQAARPEGVALQVHLVDDGSSDGTGAAVTAAFPDARVLTGDGSLFWGGGMRMAFASARPTAPDAYLWLNDDTLLLPEGLDRIVGTWRGLRRASPACAVVGATRAPDRDETTYSGVRLHRHWGRPVYETVPAPEGEPVPCQTMNGNCVLISREAAEAVGELDPRFPHGMGDFDYGFRLTKAGIPLLVCPGWIGTCAHNPIAGTWRDRALPLSARWKKLTGIKGLPARAWFHYCFRHMGWYAPVSFVTPYVRLLRDSFGI